MEEHVFREWKLDALPSGEVKKIMLCFQDLATGVAERAKVQG